MVGSGPSKVATLIDIVRDDTDARLPSAARFALSAIADQIEGLACQITKLETAIIAEAKRDEDMRRLTTIPGVGAIIAASIKALVPDPAGFRSGRHLAAWLGLTPKSHSSGGKERLGKISKMGNTELRSLLVLGANFRPATRAGQQKRVEMGDRDFGTTTLQGCRRRTCQ